MYLYLLENLQSNKYYIGVTDNIQRRLEEHNGNSSHYTGKGIGIWKLVGMKSLEVNEAYKEERRLKKCKNKRYVSWYFSQLGP